MLGTLIPIPLVFIVLSASLSLVVVDRTHIIRSLRDARIIHMSSLDILQGLVCFLDEFELLKSSWLLVYIRVILFC